MGVKHEMVAKAELVPSKALGDSMEAAFAQVALPGGAAALPNVIPIESGGLL